MKKFCFLILFFSSSVVFAQNTIPKFTDYPVNEIYSGKNHPLVMDDFGKDYKTRLRDAIAQGKPTFAGRYLVTGWGCGSGGCNTGAIIDAITGKAYPFPIAMMGVSLKPEFEGGPEQEHIYQLNSRLMIFAGHLDGVPQGDGMDTVAFYEFKDGKFIFLKSMPYNKMQRD